jgi:hypothetical protein
MTATSLFREDDEPLVFEQLHLFGRFESYRGHHRLLSSSCIAHLMMTAGAWLEIDSGDASPGLR